MTEEQKLQSLLAEKRHNELVELLTKQNELLTNILEELKKQNEL